MVFVFETWDVATKNFHIVNHIDTVFCDFNGNKNSKY